MVQKVVMSYYLSRRITQNKLFTKKEAKNMTNEEKKLKRAKVLKRQEWSIYIISFLTGLVGFAIGIVSCCK